MLLDKWKKQNLLQYHEETSLYLRASGQLSKTDSNQCKMSGKERDKENDFDMLRLHGLNMVKKAS